MFGFGSKSFFVLKKQSFGGTWFFFATQPYGNFQSEVGGIALMSFVDVF